MNSIGMPEILNKPSSIIRRQLDWILDYWRLSTGLFGQALITFETTKVSNALGTVGVNGIVIDSDVSNDGAECWFKQIDEGGTRKTGSTHVKLTINEGILFPTTLSANHNQPATLGYNLNITYDGTNDPIVMAASQATEGTATAGTYHTAGPVSINGTTVEAIQSITVDFGYQAVPLGGDGEVWNTFIYAQRIAPTVRFRSFDVDAFRSLLTLDGVAQSSTDSIIYLRKYDDGGTRVANGTGEHISLTIDEGMAYANVVEGDDGAPLALDVTLRPTYDGTAAIIVVATNATIA